MSDANDLHRDTARTAMARAFKETTLSLIGLFQVYEVAPDLSAATAEVLGQVFRKHLPAPRAAVDDVCLSPLHTLADELDGAMQRTRRRRRRRRHCL
jgi:hypothetical protein